MTIGTAVVISIGILCVTFLVAVAMGMRINEKKNAATQQLTKVISEELSSKLSTAIKQRK